MRCLWNLGPFSDMGEGIVKRLVMASGSNLMIKKKNFIECKQRLAYSQNVVAVKSCEAVRGGGIH